MIANINKVDWSRTTQQSMQENVLFAIPDSDSVLFTDDSKKANCTPDLNSLCGILI